MENFKLMDTDDMDYDAVKEICRSQVKDMYAVALICYPRTTKLTIENR